MTTRHLVLAFLACVATTPAPGATFHPDGRCKDGCNYFDGDGAHIGVVEKYHLGPARAKLADGRARNAMNDIRFILRHFPNNPNALMLLDEASRRLGQPNLPDQYFKQAIAAYPDEPMTYVVHGMFLQKRGRTADAIGQYEHALSLNPSLPDAHYNLGLALVQAKRYAEANTHAMAAYRLGHPTPGLRNQLMRVGAWKPDTAESTSPKNSDAKTPAKDVTAAPDAQAEAAAKP